MKGLTYMSNMALPFPLPYPSNALEPNISRQTMLLHDNLAAGYMENFPKVHDGVPEAAHQGATALREQLRTLSFQGSGYLLHCIYFANMAPLSRGGTPGRETMALITTLTGDLDTFKSIFLAAAGAVEGPGYAMMAWLPGVQQPQILMSEEHNLKTIWGVIPLLLVDVWEHAYLLDYGTDRTSYLTNWWELINWHDVENRVVAAKHGRIPLTAPLRTDNLELQR